MAKSKEKEFEKELEKGLKSHYLADSPIVINPKSQEKLKDIDDKLLIALASRNIQDFILVTLREKTIQTELRRRKRALPPDFVKEIVDEFYARTLTDEDICSVDEFKKWLESK